MSIWSKSPKPLKLPPPPDHCHIRAWGEELVTPPKNCAQVLVPARHQPDGSRDSELVKAVYVHSSVVGMDADRAQATPVCLS